MSQLAGLQYRGNDGLSASCLSAVWQLLQTRERITGVSILSCNGFHGLMIRLDSGGPIAIKAGFASGYGGEGPRTFATVLQLLRRHNIDIEERVVAPEIMKHLSSSALTERDLVSISAAKVVLGMRWRDYIDAYEMADAPVSQLWALFEPVLPLAVVDERLVDLALGFYGDPSETVFKGIRRIEEILAKRLGVEEIGARLFDLAFAGEHSFLHWPGVHSGVARGRLLLFKGAYAAYRNSRAHTEVPDDPVEATRAFILVNELFALERMAAERRGVGDGHTSP